MRVIKQRVAWCARCHAERTVTARKPNHILHFVLTILLVGWWLVVWVIVTFTNPDGYRCAVCGAPVEGGLRQAPPSVSA